MNRKFDEAAKEMAHLYVFSAVVGALENGTISGTAYRDAQRIIKIAEAAQQKALRRYDRAVAKLMDQQP